MDEREIEAVLTAVGSPECNCRSKAEAALNRVRDARGNDEVHLSDKVRAMIVSRQIMGDNDDRCQRTTGRGRSEQTGSDEQHPAGEPGTDDRRRFDDLVARAAQARGRGEATVPIDPEGDLELHDDRRRYHAVLWVNDTPDEYRGNGRFFGDGPYPHGHIYYSENHRPEVAVSFEAMDGTVVRVKFDPETGATTTEDITAAQR